MPIRIKILWMENLTGHALSFGKRYAILNLDLMEILIQNIRDSPDGKCFISNVKRWISAVHEKETGLLTIFTTLFFTHGNVELAQGAPFTKLLEMYGNFEKSSPNVQIYQGFKLDDCDIVLQKTRWCASTGNSLEQILKAQGIDTVIISGLSLSGVVMSTVYRLYDLDFQVYVISDNVLELPLDHHREFSRVMLELLLPKMNLRVISLDEAIQALKLSG